ncbi:protein C19orf12 homolog [Mustelus asterias]
MPVLNDDLMRLVCRISEVENLQVAVKCSGKGALVAAVGAFAGGLIGGPIGIFFVHKMSVHIDDLIHLMHHISEVENLQGVVKGSGKWKCVAGALGLVGGFFCSYQGAAVGGVVGCLIGACMTCGQFKPLCKMIMELPLNQKQILSDDVHNIVQHLDWTDAAQLISLVMGNVGLQEKVMAAIIAFFLKQLNTEVRHSETFRNKSPFLEV